MIQFMTTRTKFAVFSNMHIYYTLHGVSNKKKYFLSVLNTCWVYIYTIHLYICNTKKCINTPGDSCELKFSIIVSKKNEHFNILDGNDSISS